MNKIKNCLKRHEIIVFLWITFLFTWILWITAHVLYKTSNNSLGGALDVLAGFMPSIMAICITGYFYGIDEIKRLFSKVTIWKVNWSFYVFALGITFLIIFITNIICNADGLSYRLHIINEGYGFKFYNPINILVFFLIVLVFGGPLGEEFGWRGFVLPRLQRKISPILSSVILAVVWTLWHLPLFLLRPKDYILSGHGFLMSFTLYFIETVWLAVLFTWLYNRTRGSLLLSILYHASDDVVIVLFNINEGSYNTFTIIMLYIVRLIVLVIIVIDMKRKLFPVIKEGGD